MMKQSIVIPAYNEEAIIGDLLRYLRSLDQNIEIVVVANGCTDNTAQKAAPLADIVVVEEEGNIPKAKNLGMKAASGNLVTFLDADTYPQKDYFEKTAELYNNGFFEEYDGLYTRIYPLEGDKELAYFLYHLFCRSPIRSASGSCMTIKADRFGTGFNENVYGDDHDMARRHNFKYMYQLTCLTSTRRLNKWGIVNMFKFYVKGYFQVQKRQRSAADKEYY